MPASVAARAASGWMGWGGSLHAAEPVVRTQRDDQAVAVFAGLFEQVDVAWVQLVEAAVGEADPAALAAPALDLLDRCLAGDDLAERSAPGGERVEKVGFPRDGGADLADDDAGGHVGDTDGDAQGQARGEAGGERCHDSIAGAREVEHVRGLGRVVVGAFGVDEGHAIFGAGDQHGAEAMGAAERGGGGDDGLFAVDGHLGRFGEFAAVGGHDIGARRSGRSRIRSGRRRPDGRTPWRRR